MSLDHTEAHLAAEARYAGNRVALYRQRMYAGGGDLRRLAELERVASGAAERLARHCAMTDGSAEDAGPRTNLAAALADVGERLSAPGLGRDERMALLQRQAELGDLRDAIALRDRRRAIARPPGRS
ncbi:MAG: hypothetical protein HZB46_18540 [Solirubrobacterales bacterium]|nr:hypothetical protein [Solirubrobacterales bacterium]